MLAHSDMLPKRVLLLTQGAVWVIKKVAVALWRAA